MPLQAFEQSLLQAFQTTRFVEVRVWDSLFQTGVMGHISSTGEMLSQGVEKGQIPPAGPDTNNMRLSDLDGIKSSSWNHPDPSALPTFFHIGSNERTYVNGTFNHGVPNPSPPPAFLPHHDTTYEVRNALNGTLLHTWTALNREPFQGDGSFFFNNELYVIVGVSTDSVSSANSHELDVLNPTTGAVIRSWVLSSNPAVSTNLHLAIIGGEVYVSATGTGVIKVYSTSGTLDRTLNVAVGTTNQLSFFPIGSGGDFVAIHNDGNADHNLFLVSDQGTILAKLKDPRPVVFGSTITQIHTVVANEVFVSQFEPSPGPGKPDVRVYSVSGLQAF